MRTTVTLDEDVERMLREAMHRSRQGFKDTLNSALRAGLRQQTSSTAETTPFVVRAKPMGLRAGLDATSLNKLSDELETEAMLEKNRKNYSK